MRHPLVYDEPLFRPPSEAYSAIVQATLGCGWNRCAYCDMYASKAFRVRPVEETQAQIAALGQQFPHTRKVFLADGNAFVLPFDQLMHILELVHRHLPNVFRVSAYALPANIRAKTLDELIQLRENGLSLLYIGVESGHDPLLRAVNKSETAESAAEGILKAHEAGMQTSVMIINGLGGRSFSAQHAEDSARLMNRVQPRFLSTLALFLPRGLEDYQAKFKGDYIPQDDLALLEEMRGFLVALELQATIFRSNHVSNLMPLKGTLPKDKVRLLEQTQAMIVYAQENDLRRFSPARGY